MTAHHDDDPFTQFDDIDSLDSTDFSDFDDPSSALSQADDLGQDYSGDSLPDGDGFDEAPAGAPQPAHQAPNSVPASPESKPFLKTGIGMLTAGLAAVGVIGGSVAGYSMLMGGEEYVEEVAVAPVAPASEPSFAPVVTQAPVATQAPVPTQVQPPAQVPEQVVSQQQGLSPLAAQIQADAGQIAPQAQNMPAPQVASPSNNTGASGELLAQIKSQGEDIKLLKEAVDNITAETKLVRQQLSRNENNQEIIQKNISQVMEKIEKAVTAPVESPDEVPARAESEKAKEPAKESKVAPSNNPLAGQRDRIPDYHVVEASASGKMAIIKSRASDRVFTVFKGEVLNIGGQRHVVDSIADKGHLVLVGNKLYIDKTLEARPVSQAPKAAAKSVSRPAPVAAAPVTKDAKGFTLNAVYDADSSFGIVDDKGSFKSYKVGQSVPELGGAKVIGLDAKGNLKVGDYIIKSIY